MPSYVLNASKALSNYGIKIYGSTYDPCFTQGYMSSKPNLSIIGSSCFIDYTDTNNISDLTYLIKLFESTPAGTTFSFSQGNYYDPVYEYIVDTSGVFSLESINSNNKLIVGQIVSGFTYTTNYKFYNKSNFIDPPQYSTNYTGGTTSSNYVENNLTVNPGKSLLNLGLVGYEFGKEEYIEISGSTLNTGKLKVNSVLKLKDNREIAYTTVTLSNENLSTNNITLTHYLRGDANPEILSKSRKNLGCYVVYDSNGNQIQCFENQNQLQAFLRSQYETSSYTTQWIPCLFCSRLTDNGFNGSLADKSILYDASVFLLIEEQTFGTLDGNGNIVLTYSYNLKSNYYGNDNITPITEMNFTIDNGLKIDLSHPTLKGFEIDVYSDSGKTIPVIKDLYLIGVPGFDQSSLIYTKTQTSPRILYIELVGPNVISLKIIIE
jgi:hypothetical protein